MPKFRKKSVVVEAVRWTGENTEEVLDFGYSGPQPLWGHDFRIDNPVVKISGVKIFTPEGEITANPGDWIIRGVKGELYPCKPDIFEATYEPLPVARTPDGEPVKV